MSDLQKGVILNGQDSLAVFKDDGLVYRAAEIESYTLIVLRNLKANTTHQFELKSVISKDYRVVDAVSDVKGDDSFDGLSEADANNINYPHVYFTVAKEGKRIFSQAATMYGTSFFGKVFLISSENIIRITPQQDINTITLICQPIYLENTIVVPEVILNDSNNTGNENPSPEPVVD